MIVQDLKQIHGSRAVAVIFMQAQSPKTPEEFTIDVSESIHHQLTGGKHYKSKIELSASKNEIATLRNSIYRAVHATPRTFLVIEDLDSCGYHSVKLLEEELDTLQKHGLRTMITSRIARYPTSYLSCDAEGGHSIAFDCDAWFRSEC